MKQSGFTEKTHRLFVAIVPDQAFLQSIRPGLDALKKKPWPGRVRWTPSENLHLTVRFLGDTGQERYRLFLEALRSCASSCKGFDLCPSHLVFLPKASKARVIALGFQPVEELAGLASSLEKAAVSCGFDPEKRPFVAHLTLGRLAPQDLRPLEAGVSFQGVGLRVRTIDLVKSTLTGSGAVYETLDTVKLMPGA